MIYAALIDILSFGSQRDCVMVLPTLDHAVNYWTRAIAMFKETHGEEAIVTTRTAIVSRRTKSAVRLWVPYSRDPTMPADHERVRRVYDTFLNLYGLYHVR